MGTFDPAWIARTLSEQAISDDAAPAATIGRVAGPRAREDASASVSLELPILELVREGEAIDPRSPHLHVRGRLGEGGMGIVELAYQPLLNRDVAVKRLVDIDPTNAALLLREARITGSLEHANIIPIHAIGSHPQLGPLVVMKRIQGESWEARLALDRARLAEDENVLAAHVEILTRVCRAVEFAHSRGVIHRDLKPSNVMLGEFGELYVVDWGLALELGADTTSRLVGSPAYMPPEMAAGARGRVDPRSDVYLLGATLHEVITGAHRHAASTVLEALNLAATSAPHDYDPAVPEELARICNRACHRDPDQRFPDVATMRTALQQYLEHRRATAVLRAALRRHERLKQLLRHGARQRSEVELNATYREVVIRYEQALDIWEDLAAARAGREQVMLDMLGYELERANIHGAQRIADELGVVPEELRARLRGLIEDRQTTEARLSSLEEEVVLRTAQPARLRVITGIVVSVALINVVFFYLDPSLAANSPPERLVSIAVVMGIVAALMIAPRWRQLTANLAGRQYTRFVSVTIALMIVNRVRGLILDEAPIAIMSGDLLLVGTGLCIIRLPLPGMVQMGSTIIGAGLAMALLPGYSRVIFLVTSSAVPLVMLLLDRLYRGPSHARDRARPRSGS